MPVFPVESLDDPRIEIYRNLRSTNRTRDLGMMVAESDRVVRRMIDSDCEMVSLLASHRKLDKCSDWIPRDLPVYVIAEDDATRLVGFDFHGGLLGCALRPPSPLLAELVDHDRPVQTLLACPGVTDPQNLGVIIRLATAFGADGMLADNATADPFSRRTLRVSTGSALKLPIRNCENLVADIDRLRQEWGFETAGAIIDPQAVPLHEVQRPGRLILMLGNETRGLSDELQELCDHRWTIPMTDLVNSINVSVAAGIFLHAVFEQGRRLDF
jgi:tRNA G18 (ribose-2'-O)-methylase SpoU